jgi:hypothetical protein
MTQAPELPSLDARVKAIQIFAPDRHSTELLLLYAAPHFPAEISPGFVWIVKLQPPPTGGGWVVDFLSIVRRWLEMARLPWANVLYDGHRYLIRPAPEIVQSA